MEAWLVDALKATGFTGELEAVFGRGQVVTGVAMLGGSVAGGLIAQQTSLGVPFVLRGLILVAMFVVAFRLMHDVGFSPEKAGNVLAEIRKITSASMEYGLRVPAVRWLMIESLFTGGVGIYGFYALQPYLLQLYGDRRAYVIAGLAALDSPSPSATPTPQPTSQLLPGFTCADASGGPEQAGSDVVSVRVGQHDGYDRLVIEYSDAIPSYKVQRRSRTSFTESPRGQAVTFSGTDGVLVVVHPVTNWTSYTGPVVFQPDYPVQREARQVENFEGYQQRALGIQGTPCLRVTTLTQPSRLVVDVAATQ